MTDQRRPSVTSFPANEQVPMMPAKVRRYLAPAAIFAAAIKPAIESQALRGRAACRYCGRAARVIVKLARQAPAPLCFQHYSAASARAQELACGLNTPEIEV